MVYRALLDLPGLIPGMAMDAFVVMPNHLHALVFLGTDPQLVTQSPALGSIVGRFKSITTRRYIDGVTRMGWPRFDDHLWQRNYYDHIARSDRGIERIRAYIEGNPARWQARMDALSHLDPLRL